MLGSFLRYRPYVLKPYRIARAVVLCLAALYVAMAAFSAVAYVGPNSAILGFVAKSLRADAYDMLSTMKDMVFGDGIGIGHRPVRYALICQPLRGDPAAYEAENVSNEKRARRQISSKSGAVYNNLTAVLGESGAQPVLFLSNGDGGAKVCAARAYWLQDCQCDGKSTAVERSRILAKDLFN
jgi:hypothetical protein